MKKTYHIVNREKKCADARIEQFAKANGQWLLPLVELITQARVAVDEVINAVGRRTIEAILMLSAEEVAGEQTPGKLTGEIRWHGSQSGRVGARQPPIKSQPAAAAPQTGRRDKVPAYEGLQDNGATAERMMGALLRGVFTRQYEEVLPQMAETAGVSRSSVSRQAIKGSAEQLRQRPERCWDKTDLLVISIDGRQGQTGKNPPGKSLASNHPVECAWAASKTKDCFLEDRFWRQEAASARWSRLRTLCWSCSTDLFPPGSHTRNAVR